ncbi:MAG: class I SAM-dependent methyltransferase [Pseudomonadales bacterium]|jgi:SAM-dependent methyltransferase|nr:hypothetical protein [Gammaproteobacteria bacterium]MDP6024896.1 class I SAM-dependent methyltransferase [Pseudomonadales bacterium]MDP6315387.1 class I SAM-dependent methyltransferase [Pseudomonadales bacterium]MDP7316552.1 class I SAM-dependent methyltransferase [Pseudomonadales bacterium]MDP7577464.1 class I SAM-dependent methyltransferase [Pseudomonadales bacterium]|tara:strand:+ start:257 stop:907 length:651 start_codon:yes stop_codon:yes gene_type:complete
MAEEKIRTYGVDSADNYWREREAEGRVSEKRVHRFIRDLVVINVGDSGNVLICGVGDGHEYRLCAKHFNTWGVEMSRYAIEQYDFDTHNIVEANLNNGIPDFEEKFDAITISMVLHWLDDPEEFLSQAKSSLTENGCLVVVIPNITYYQYRLKYLFGHFPPISASHKNFQTPIEVEQLFRRAGYRIIERLSSKDAIKTRTWPTLFATDIGYVIKPL